ncbi:molybdenum cofactor sulfurase [Aminobacter anthyllidis]|uniref:Molybdenum cofactor sulfurase n=1 Tax=Aminobacter anthyllidis TaxID=1035067 RepID=A0A9X1AAS0_9HYPH|nr:molybdenum cofactor sulfurase [Aminobacter anthyllidis]MBT1156268.1 molybdenum cofactor sulfurase [Aminobacter anthyllidis]
MLDPTMHREGEPEILPGRKLAGRVAGVYTAQHDHFVTRPTDALRLTFEGIIGDVHSGHTRRSGGREPWYPRGTEMRNERQLSIVAPDELAIVAERMGLAEIKPEWIGANLLLDGVPMLSMLPAGTMLFFKGGVTIKIDGQNAPCRIAGRSIAEHAGMADHDAGSLMFPKVSRRLRGLVGWVEKPGMIAAGEEVSVRVPEQWIYRA